MDLAFHASTRPGEREMAPAHASKRTRLHLFEPMIPNVLSDTILHGGTDLKELQTEPFAGDPPNDGTVDPNGPLMIAQENRQSQFHPHRQRNGAFRTTAPGGQILRASFDFEIIFSEQKQTALGLHSSATAVFVRGGGVWLLVSGLHFGCIHIRMTR